VPRVTLFLFGGLSELRSEPPGPGAELVIALVGPLTSLALGALCLLGVAASAGPGFGALAEVDPVGAIGTLSPLTTLLLWLGPLNLMLGVFNLIPGFPLDGGRALRALFWKATGDRDRATRWASVAGQAAGWAMMAWGLVQVLAGSLGGLWLGLVGWFLHSAARRSREDVVVRGALDQVQVRDLMRTRFDEVGPDVPLPRFIDEQLLRGGQTAWPVVRDQHPLGLVTFEQVASVPGGPRAPDGRRRDAAGRAARARGRRSRGPGPGRGDRGGPGGRGRPRRRAAPPGGPGPVAAAPPRARVSRGSVGTISTGSSSRSV
jgi:Zn-dependent protease